MNLSREFISENLRIPYNFVKINYFYDGEAYIPIITIFNVSDIDKKNIIQKLEDLYFPDSVFVVFDKKSFREILFDFLFKLSFLIPIYIFLFSIHRSCSI